MNITSTFCRRKVLLGEGVIMLLGTAATLSKIKNQINGTVYFIFQHAEEQPPGGALQLIESGVLEDVDAFFGIHVLPNFPVGHAGFLPVGAASTTWDGFNLTIKGKGSHGSMPHLGIDPIVANHNPQFNIDEKALVEGVKVEVQIILDYLTRNDSSRL